MEAERQRPPEDQLEGRLEDVLPPPPAPFPTELVEAAQTNGHSVSDRLSQTQIGSLQRSIIDVLTDLLASSPSLDRPTNLSNRDQRLATALTALLEVTYDLDSSDHSHVEQNPNEASLQASFDALTRSLEEIQGASRTGQEPADGFSDVGGTLHPAVYAVRQELAWARLDSLGMAVMTLVRERGETTDTVEGELVNGRYHEEDTTLPPRYSFDEAADTRTEKADLPDYSDRPNDPAARSENGTMERPAEKVASTSLRRSVSAPREKMILELDGLTDAIDRLHSAIPRLNDQRVEMRASSSKASVISPAARARAERNKLRELEIIWNQIERTHGKSRSEEGQRVDTAGWAERRAKQKEQYLLSLFDGDERRLDNQDSSTGKVDAELARARDLRDRDLFLRDLVEQSADSRLSDQDAAHTPTTAHSVEERRHRFLAGVLDRSRSGHLDGQDFPMTLDERLEQRRREFIESVVERTANGRLRNQDSAPSTPRVRAESSDTIARGPEELVTMQDFFNEKRQRSNSTPNDGEKRGNGFDRIKGIIRRGSAGLGLKINNDLELANLAYLAEHQENLNVVQVMVHGVGISATSEIVIETHVESCEQATLISKTSTASQAPLTLPVPAVAGQSIPLILQNFHLEGRLACLPTYSSAPISSLNTVITQALSASELRQLRPRSLCCSTCDREVADIPNGGQYKDLPSEHWAEMLEIWMCHSDPSFTAGISARAKDGFWPDNGTILVGGSYLLLNATNVKRHNLSVGDQAVSGWKSVHCGCGEVMGKQRDLDGQPGAGTVRFSKWSIALLQEDSFDADTVEPIRYPISVFIVSDLLELAQAHASYRFIINDKETGQTRLALWLFNPSTRISYRQAPSAPQPSPLRTPKSVKRRSFTSAKSRRSSNNSLASMATPIAPSSDVKSIRASKIMYKVIEDGQGYEGLSGFGPAGQVERMSYPLDVCERLVAILRESNARYPVARRTMGAFDVGFLERV